MKYLIIIIIILTMLEYLLIKNITRLIKLNSIITIISGYISILISYILIYIINKKIYFINISKITNIFLKKGIDNGLIIILIGGIELIIYVLIKSFNEIKKKN